jgi:[ribosomal protein S5]-alanine N-acetyltransferase
MIETERLILQPFTLEDFDDLMQLHADPEVNRFFKLQGAWPEEFVRHCLTGFIKDHQTLGYSKFKVTLKDGTFVGRAGFSLWEETGETELGYSFKRDYWGKGYATEASQKLVRWIFEATNLEHIIAFAALENLASRNVLEKIGMGFTAMRLVNNVPQSFLLVLCMTKCVRGVFQSSATSWPELHFARVSL